MYTRSVHENALQSDQYIMYIIVRRHIVHLRAANDSAFMYCDWWYIDVYRSVHDNAHYKVIST